MLKNKPELTKENCIEWMKNKDINPLTKYKITYKGKVYKEIEKKCKEFNIEDNDIKINAEDIYYIKKKIFKEPIQKMHCEKWLKNKYISPFTNYGINEKSPKFKTLTRECNKLQFQTELNPGISIIEKKPEPKNKNPRYTLKKDPTEKECIEWKKNKLRNPTTKTKNPIVENGAIYNSLKEKCKDIKEPQSKPQPEPQSKPQPEPQSKPQQEPKPEPQSKPEPKPEPEKEIKITTPYLYKDKKDEKEYKDTYYPDLDDENFNEKLLNLKEIRVHKISQYKDINSIEDFENKSSELCAGFDKSSFQYLMGHYLSYRTPYKSLLLYYDVGVGKTCTAITIAENLLINHNSYDEPKIWVILPAAIQSGFKNQVFNTFKLMDFKTIMNQCTGDTYVKLAEINEETDINIAKKRIKKLIKSRYQFFTYEGFASHIENNYINKGILVSNKVIIVDEAHNIRNSTGDDETNKRVYNALINTCKTGYNNKLVLLSATPMYNEPNDIYMLFHLLLLNDKREELYKNPVIFDENNNITEEARKYISLMSSNYISYLRGKNPFNFAFKLSPDLSGYEILNKTIENTERGNPIEQIDKEWVKKIKDGIVISNLGEKQLEFLKQKQVFYDENPEKDNNFSSLQPMNIVYDNQTGKQGFNNMFIKTTDKEQLIVRYNSTYKNALSPSNIHKYSGKYAKIASIIKKTKGIIVIYSKYIWSGIIPIAIMLEHMGFSRKNTNNILSEPIITDEVKYDDVKTPSYCILSSSDPEIMGNTTIDSFISIINSYNNKNGELIKVILMTPVAGEGISFHNVREMHITEPWYHFNRIDQIIGRGIRNCSHKTLPLRDRNVTVFMHCAIDTYKKETADIHAFRISTRKLYQTTVIDTLIRNTAIDCSLFKSINYFSPSMFKLGDIDIITSQGNKIKYKLGDDDIYEPKCKVNLDDIEIKNENSVGYREETYKHLSLSIQKKLKKLILEVLHKGKRFITLEEIKTYFELIDIKIIMNAIRISIYPNVLIDNITLIPHKNGIHIIDVIQDNPIKLKLFKEMEKEEEEQTELQTKLLTTNIKNNFTKKMESIKEQPYDTAIVGLYSSMDEKTFKMLIKKIIETPKELNEIDKFIEKCFLKEGILITNKEIQVSSNPYVGFVNIYNEEFEPLLYNDGINFKNLSPKQIETLIKGRKQVIKITDMSKEKIPYGLMIPAYENKQRKNKINQFKLLTPGITYGKKTGIVCTSLQKKEHSQIFKEISLDDNEKNTKESYCNKIASKLHAIQRLLLLPEYKPI